MQPSVISEIRTPRSIEEVTAEWMTSALAVAYPNVEVERCVFENAIWGMAGKARFRLAYNEVGRAANLPATMFVKAGFGKYPPEYEWNYTVEVWAYAWVLPYLETNAPRCYYAAIDEEGRAVVLLEDLLPRNVRFCNLLEPLEYSQAARFLDAYARIHAKWWDSPELEKGGKFDFLVHTMDQGDLGAGFWVNYCLEPENWKRKMGMPRGNGHAKVPS